MARKRAKRQGLRTHRSYTVDEAAKALGLCKATVRRWIKLGRIKPIDDQRPAMLAGPDLIALTTGADKPKRRCKANEAYCLRCRDVRPMAFNEAEIIAANASGSNLRALCGTCSTLMRKRVSLRALPDLARELTLSAPLALQHLISTQQPRPNVHFKTLETTRPKPSEAGALKSLQSPTIRAVGQCASIANTVSTNPTNGA
jgi:hypothetical protein